ncbi:MAG: hypothetical protein R3B93_28290 [Bacteroidia bacterium]
MPKQDNTVPAQYVIWPQLHARWTYLEEKKFDAMETSSCVRVSATVPTPTGRYLSSFNNIRETRIFGNIAVKYNILPGCLAQGRIGQDYWSATRVLTDCLQERPQWGPAPAGL